jgi:hypothetical protein
MTTLTLILLLFAAPQDDPIKRGDHPESIDAARFTTDQPGRELPLPDEEDMFTFVVFGDRTGGPAEGISILADAVTDTNLFEPDLVMTVGDLVNGYNTTEPWMAQMREFRGVMDELLCPWFPVAGNHDVYWRGAGRPPQEHEDHYAEHFGPLWYAFDHKDCRFIVLYTDEANPTTGERNFSKPASQKMSPAQLSWLESTLEEAKDMKHVFVFLHHPRWLRGNYGDDWSRVHTALANAGNVRACFAGHIHYMRYDGVKDGIEYVTLATIGGSQSGAVPEAGYLHQFHVVTVRQDGIALASVPVGETMDVRGITGAVARETRTLANTVPAIKSTLAIAASGEVSGTAEVFLTNPTSRPIDFEIVPESADSRWWFVPDHVHGHLEPGKLATVSFAAHRKADPLDWSYKAPKFLLKRDYIGTTARYSIPERSLSAAVSCDLPKPELPPSDLAINLANANHSIWIPSASVALSDGPFTLETWFRASKFDARVGLFAKTEMSEYGFFLSRGVPEFSVHLDGAYRTASDPTFTASLGTWHHIAGVYDGKEVRLYIDGTLMDAMPASGKRTRNDLPLILGGDVTGDGRLTSPFTGLIDSARLSTIARYAGASFKPARRLQSDEDTLLLLNFDKDQGGFVFDESPKHIHQHMRGGAGLVPANEGP